MNSASRDAILGRVREALHRKAGDVIEDAPPVRLDVPELGVPARIAGFRERFEALNGKVHVVSSRDGARQAITEILNGRAAVASNARFLEECGIGWLSSVRTGLTDREELKAACAEAPVGITSAQYAIASTGTLAMLSSAEEPRLVSLLPPAHIAVIPASRILVNLDELFEKLPLPADVTSALVFISGPSRTADIEQILVRGVHGPGEIHVVIVEGC
ncbi:MAG TPA: lactate utilization protein [Bryobacteraceae bacterium]